MEAGLVRPEGWGAGGAETQLLCSLAGHPQSLSRINDSWVPELQRMGMEVPYLLVGCKSDLRQPGQTLQQVGVWPCCLIPTIAKSHHAGSHYQILATLNSTPLSACKCNTCSAPGRHAGQRRAWSVERSRVAFCHIPRADLLNQHGHDTFGPRAGGGAYNEQVQAHRDLLGMLSQDSHLCRRGPQQPTHALCCLPDSVTGFCIMRHQVEGGPTMW